MQALRNLFKREAKGKSRPLTNDFDKLFFIGKKLGQGAFAVVSECTRKSDSQKFAVKVISKAKLKGELDAVINEIDILKKICHPNIISLEDMYETNENYYLVMHLATGGELFERILEKGSYTEADAAMLVKQLISAISYLHDEVDIVHRDLKPENLLFRDKREDSDLMVTDFGLSKNIHNEILGTTCGSPHYVAPEVLKGVGHGKPVDMWALGVITFVLLCGYTPFWGGEENSTTLLYQDICAGKYEFESQYWEMISDEAKTFIGRLLLINPDARMTASQAADHPWLCTENKVDILPTIKKNFNPKRTFKKAALAIKLTNRLVHEVSPKKTEMNDLTDKETE